MKDHIAPGYPDIAKALLKNQLRQAMEQVCCEKVTDLPKHLISEKIK